MYHACPLKLFVSRWNYKTAHSLSHLKLFHVKNCALLEQKMLFSWFLPVAHNWPKSLEYSLSIHRLKVNNKCVWTLSIFSFFSVQHYFWPSKVGPASWPIVFFLSIWASCFFSLTFEVGILSDYFLFIGCLLCTLF